MPPSKLQRQLDLIAYLVGRRIPVPVEELMERIAGYSSNWNRGDKKGEDTARRAFERDKDELRRAGIPLKTVRYLRDGEEQEGYEITRRDFYLPYLKLVTGKASTAEEFREKHRPAKVEISEDDTPLALDALRFMTDLPSFPLANEARSAFRKLAFDLDPLAFSSRSRTLFFERPGADELTERLRILSAALLARKRLRFRYHGIHRGEETDRDVEAYGLIFQHGNWYLVGHDATRNDRRIFRVGRMDSIQPNTRAPNQPDYTIPADFKLSSYTGRQAWELGNRDEKPLEAEVRFRFPQSVWAERNRYGRLNQQHADGSATRAFDVHQVNPFLRWVLSLEGDASIVSPVELREQLKELASTIAAAHAEDENAGE